MNFKKLSVLAVGFIAGVTYMFQSGMSLAGNNMGVTHTSFPADSVVQDYVDYAWKISGGDIRFLNTLDGENGAWTHTRQSEVRDNRGCTGDGKGKEDSRGFCQLNRCWHKDVVDDKRFRDDPYRQLDQCYAKFKGGTKFYGYKAGRITVGPENDDMYKSETVTPKPTQKTVTQPIEKTRPKECYFATEIMNADYVQIDTGDGEYVNIVDTAVPGESKLKVFNCFGDKHYK